MRRDVSHDDESTDASTGRSALARRLAGLIRWLAVPWADTALALALVGAAATPAFLVSAADVWQEAAGDQIADTLAGGSDLDLSGAVITTLTTFTPDATRQADRLITARLAAIENLEPAVRYQLTFRSEVYADPPLSPTGAPVRLLAADGAVASLDVATRAEVAEPSVWVSTWFADRAGITAGDVVAFPAPLDPNQAGAEVPSSLGPVAEVAVAGTYEPIWSESGPPTNPYWQTVPDDLVPTYLEPFNAPAFALFVMEPSSMEMLPVTGATRWAARAERVPGDIGELRAMAASYRALEEDLTTDAELAAALTDLAGGATLDAPGFTPIPETTFETTLHDTLAEAETALGQLDQPLASARSAGVVMGLAIMAASGFFIVQRRRSEYVLLAGEGDRWWRFAPRAAAQLLLPSAIGLAVGVLAAAEIGRRIGPASAFDLTPVDLATTAAVVAAGAGLAALAVGLFAQGTLDRGVIGARPRVITSIVAMAAVTTAAFLWVLVGTTRGTGPVDLAVVAFPLVALVAAASVVAWMIGRASRGVHDRGGRLPLVPWLALRRLGTRSEGPRVVTAAAAVGVGLIVFSTLLVSALDTGVDAKLATEVGGVSRVSVLAPERSAIALPDASTIVATSRSRIVGRSDVVTVVAVDAATLADAVFWPDEFGGELADVLALLAEPIDGTLPVVALDSQSTPDAGALGVTRTVPYQVVARTRSFTLADDFGVSILVDAARLDALELERLAAAAGTTIDDPDLLAAYTPPTSRFSKVAVSMLPLADLQDALEAQGLVTRDGLARDTATASVDVLAPRIAFDYLRLLGGVSALAAVAGLLLYLAERRTNRALAALLMRRMGITAPTSALVTMTEVLVLGAVAVITAVAAAPPVAGRLIARFDPRPALPPEVAIGAPGPVLLVGIGAGVVVLAAIVWAIDLRSSRVAGGEVLRGLD